MKDKCQHQFVEYKKVSGLIEQRVTTFFVCLCCGEKRSVDNSGKVFVLDENGEWKLLKELEK